MHGEQTGLPSGFHDIDEMTTGFQPGNFVIVAARPGMGKTSFALNMAVSAARATNQPIAFFSLEMSNNELVQRLICSEGAHFDERHAPRQRFARINGTRSLARWASSTNCRSSLTSTGALTVSDLRSRCRRLRAKHKTFWARSSSTTCS